MQLCFHISAGAKSLKNKKGLISTHTDENKGYVSLGCGKVQVHKYLYTLHASTFSQSRYRGRVEIGGVYIGTSPLSVHHNFVRDEDIHCNPCRVS